MFTSAEKTNQSTFVSRQAKAGGAFFGKAEPQSSFFSPAQEATTGAFFTPGIQAKLSVSQPDDPQEKEADKVADQVMRMAEPVAAAENNAAPNEDLQRKEEEKIDRHEEEQLQRSAADNTISSSISIGESIAINRHAEKEEEKVQAKSYLISRHADDSGEMASAGADEQETEVHAKLIHRKPSQTIFRSGRAPPASQSNTATFEHSLSSSRGEGSPMPDGTRQFMENRFGTDFSGVRIHTDSRAENMSKSISAHAFTYGNDIYFNNGKYSPNTADGSLLLAHELTHTIQQGASPAMSKSVAAKSIQLKSRVARKLIQRMEASTQRNAAVELATAEQGKVSANQEGPDGKRMGWERLLEYFKTTFGEDKILPEGAAFQQGTVNEGQIKKKSTFNGNVMDPNDGVTVLHNQPRDAMPSWCGIFAFWALNKAGIPLKKWQLGRAFIPPDAAYPPNHQPQPGDIAYRKEFSHYALVSSSDGTNVTSINGNTAGDDNVGGEVQVQTHPRDHWFAFFDPTKIMEGSLRNPDSPDTAPVRSLRELRKQLFNVNRKAENENTVAPEETEEKVQAKTDTSSDITSVQAQAESTANTTAAPAPVTTEHVAEEQSGEQEKETEGSCCSQFDIHRSFETGQHSADDGSTEHEAATESETTGTQNIQRQVADATPLTRYIQRQKESPGARGPPRGPPVVQGLINRKVIQRSWLGDAWDAVSGFVSEAAEWVERGLDAAKGWLLRRVRDFVSNIPGYSMMCLVLGEDPITGEATPMTGETLLNAGLDLLPGGFMFRQLMMRLGIFGDVATWLQGRMEDMSTIASGIADRFLQFWDRLSLDDVGDPEAVMNRVADLLRSTINDIVGFVERSASEFLSMIKRVMIREIADFVRTRIPRLFPLLTVALGFNPETMETVARNGTNILNAFLELSDDGQEQRKQMMETGTFQRIAGWIDRGISVFSRAYTLLVQAFQNIWNYVTIENLFSPVQTFTRIYNEFSEPVSIVSQFIIDAAIEILRIIKDALMARLSAFARETRGYSLVCVIIGRDPFTGQVVPRTVHNLVRGFMSLMDGGEQQYEQLRESGAIDRIINKVNAAVAELNMTPQAIIQLFIDLWNSFSIRDLANPIAAFQRIIATFGRPILRLIAFVIRIIMIVIEAILILMDFPFDLINNIIAKARQAFEMIKRDPVGFLKNLLRAIKQGFIQFFQNILQHLVQGLVGWLMAEMRDANLPELQDLSLRGVISWVLQVLGISMEAIWQKLAAHPRIGPARVARIRSMINTLEGIWTFIRDVQERGMAAIWERIQEQLSNLWNTILDAVKNWIMERIVNQMVTRLLSMLDPTGIMAVINSAIAIYRAVQSFIRYLRQMLEIINSFVEGVVEIASGNITSAANFLERTLARGVPIVIGFLANQLGLTGIGHRIGEMITRAREMVDEALTWLVNRAVDTAFSLIDRLISLGRSARDAVMGWFGIRKDFRLPNGDEHEIYFTGSETSPQVMVASNVPRSVEQLVSDRRGRTPAPNAAQATALTSALTHKRALDDYIRTNRTATPTGGTSTDALRSNIDTKLDEIKTDLVNGDAIPAMVALPPSNVTYSMEGGRAKSVTARPLSKLAGNSAGTAPVQDDAIPPGWHHIRALEGARIRMWVKAHMLNENLHGPGVGWNLVPATQRLNSQMRVGCERWAKDEVDKDDIIHYKTEITGWHTNNNVPAISNYFPSTITVTYGHMPNPAKGRTQETTEPVATYTMDAPPETAGAAGPPNINTMTRDNLRIMFAGVSNIDLIYSTRATLPGSAYRDLAHMYLRLRDAYNRSPAFENTYWPIISRKYNFENAFIF